MNVPAAPIDLAKETDFAVGHIGIRPAFRQFGIDAERKVIEPRVMQVLVALNRKAGEVVGRDELVMLCWAGRIVGEDAIQRAVAKVRRLGETSGAFAVETIPRVGYQLVPAVPHVVSHWKPSEKGSPSLAVAMQPANAFSAYQAASNLMQLPSVGVLPFGNMTADPDQDYFVEGITEDIIGALSRFHEIRTVPRGSTFAYSGKAVDPMEVAGRLNLDYILTGTLRMSGKRVRISAGLIQCENCRQVWHGIYDRELADIFELQDELSRDVSAAMVPALRNAEVGRAARKSTQDITGYDLYLRALPHMWAGTKEGATEAILLLRESLRRDESAANLGALAFSLLIAPALNARSAAEALPEALRSARKAIEIDGTDAFAQAVYGITLAFTTADRNQILLHAEEAIRLNPSSAFAWGILGSVKYLLGEFASGLEDMEFAIRLSPSDDVNYLWYTFQGAARFALRDYGNAITAARKAVLHNPNFGTAHRLLAASLAISGSTDEARAVTSLRDLVQTTSLNEIRAMRFFQQPQIMERYLAAQKLCGVID